VVVRGHQRSSEAIRGHQRSPEVIRGNNRSSEVIRGRQRQSVDNQGSIRGNHGAKCDRYLDETLRRTPTTTPTTTPSHSHRRHRRHRRHPRSCSLIFGTLGLAIKRRVEPQAGLLQTEEQSACNQHAISMQSACTRHVISMQSACTQHAISRRHLKTEELAEIGAHRVRDVDVRGWHGALLMQPMDKVRGACGDVRDSAL